MPGGGPHKVGPGQITDDSEMAMAMLQCLGAQEKVAGTGSINMNLLAEQYKEWVKSNPFDMGITTQEALCPLLEVSDVN